MSKDKNFVSGGCGRRHKFDNGDTVRNMYMKLEDLQKLPRSEKGYIKVCYVERGSGPDQYGNLGYFYEDDFVPDKSKSHEGDASKGKSSRNEIPDW